MDRAQKRDTFFTNLKLFRENHNMSLSKFAEILEVKRQGYTDWENGRHGATLRTVRKLCKNLSEYFGKTYELRDFLGEGPPV